MSLSRHAIVVLSAALALAGSTAARAGTDAKPADTKADAKAAAAPAMPAPAPLAPTFEKMKTLVGDWTGKGPEGHTIKLSYTLTSGGSALVETMDPGDHAAMTTIYHSDGDSVMLTHYCGLANQPRMRAKAGDKELAFAFVDATNLPSADAPHMHSLKLTMEDNDHLTQEWTFRAAGQERPEVFRFERKK
jgi:hypothetical protein